MIIELKNVQELKKLLIVSGHTLSSLSKKLGISVSHTSNICNGKRSPSPVIAKKICDELQVEFEQIFFVNDVCKCKVSEAI